MNSKGKGEKGECITIGELAKWGIDVAIPLSDNFRWDFILIYDGKLYTAQVKSSTIKENGVVSFNLTSSYWRAKITKTYTEEDCDIMILCDYEKIYLLTPKEFSDVHGFAIRTVDAKNKQRKNTNRAEDFIISEKRIKKVFTK